MKNFKDYLSESINSKKHEFRVKIAGFFDKDQEEKLKTMLERYQVDVFKKLKTTPVQALPLDFPQVRNCEVNIFEVILGYSTTQQELIEYISSGLRISKQNLAVVRPGEPSEEYQTPTEPMESPLLLDSEYKEAGKPQFEDYYGDKYNTGFVKELNDILKLQRKERGEIIPSESVAKYNTDSPANTKSNLTAAPDPRKK
jgi:hypothetical protein